MIGIVFPALSFLLGVNLGRTLMKYIYKERSLFDLAFAIVLLVLWLLY